jgi:hypothetical protein
VAPPHSDFAQRSRSSRPQHTIPTSDADDEEVPVPLELRDTRSSIRKAKRRDTYLERWYPEDATAEDVDDLSSTIQLPLDANRIRCRCDSDKPGGKKIFVRRKDESFARGIVREISEGPPSSSW